MRAIPRSLCPFVLCTFNAARDLQSLLINCQSYDSIVLNGEAIIKANRASIKRSRHLDCNDHFWITVFDTEWLELEFVSFDCLGNPALNGFFSVQRFSLVADNRLIREAGKNGIYVMLVACIDILLNDSRQVDVHADTRLRYLCDNPVGHPAIDRSASQVFGVNVVRKTKFNPAGFVERL
jgi:hypothetical protein